MTISSMYVPLWLNLNDQGPAIEALGIQGFPAFGILDAGGKPLISPAGRDLDDPIRGHEPIEAATWLMAYHYQHWSEINARPPSAAVIIAELESLRADKQTDKADAWLARALADSDLMMREKDCLKLYKALMLRKAGKTDEGLKLLQEVASKLTVREATAEEAGKVDKAIAPFVLGRGDVVYGTVSSDVNARLAHNAILWLTDLKGDLLKPDDLAAEETHQGTVALATVLSRPLDAVPWLAAYRQKSGDQKLARDPALMLAEGMILAAQGKCDPAAHELAGLAQLMPGRSYSPLAMVLASECAKKAGMTDPAAACAQWVKDTYGPRLAPELAERIK